MGMLEKVSLKMCLCSVSITASVIIVQYLDLWGLCFWLVKVLKNPVRIFINVSCIQQENRKYFLILKYFGTVLPVELIYISRTR